MDVGTFSELYFTESQPLLYTVALYHLHYVLLLRCSVTVVFTVGVMMLFGFDSWLSVW